MLSWACLRAESFLSTIFIFLCHVMIPALYLQGNAVFKFNPELLYQTLVTSINGRCYMNLRVNSSASLSEKSFQAQPIDKVLGWALTHRLSSRSKLPQSFFVLVISVPIRASLEHASSCLTCKKVYVDCKEVELISLYIQDFVRPITSYDALQLWWDHIELCLTFVRWINTSRWNFASASSIRRAWRWTWGGVLSRMP